MRHDSREYIAIPITGPDAATLDVTAFEVSIDGGATWQPASSYEAGVVKLLVGPLSAGTYPCAVRITDTPEVVVLDAQRLTVI